MPGQSKIGQKISHISLFEFSTLAASRTVVYFKYAGVPVLGKKRTNWSEQDIINELTDENLQEILGNIIKENKFSPNKIAFAFRNLSNELDTPNDTGSLKNIHIICERVASYIEKTPLLNMIHMEATQLRL
jgi:hypothetical protein